jgi:methylmalonyl-CoA/ethylmalonyl-CoA epimerase
MVQGIHHVNFIVRDLDAAIPVYEKIFGIPVTARDHLESRGIDSARFRIGSSWFVLVQPVRPGTVPARHLEEHGEGFFLMSFDVDSLSAEIDRLGADSFSGSQRQGIEDWQVIDLDASQTSGAQLQLCATPADT